MYGSISVRDKNISIQLQVNRINILTDGQLVTLVTEMPRAATDELVSAIKKEYQVQFNKDFDVADASMAVEIWGHVFAGKFADKIKKLVPVKPVKSLAKKISSHSEVINIGTKGHDRNRFVWDWLAPFKRVIAAILLKPN